MISANNVGNFNAVKVSVGPGRKPLKNRPSQDAAHIIILSLQGVNSNYLVYTEDADMNHDVEAFVINTYNLYI